MNKSLHSLLRDSCLAIPAGLANPLISQVTCDSRCVSEGALFLGLPGKNSDGGCFWREALSSGAVAAIIGNNAAKLLPPRKSDPVVIVPNPVGVWAGEVASVFWGRPSFQMPLIGVTGTNGKTTTTYLIEHLCKSLGKPTALFGTLVNRWSTYSFSSKHTTDFADTLQGYLAAAVLSGAEIGVMEVSSHALDQQRVAGCRFEGAVFTNLTQDHLDYHSSMDEYFKTKSRLFFEPFLSSNGVNAVVNIDDLWGKNLAKRLGPRCWKSSIDKDSQEFANAELKMSHLVMTSSGVEGFLHTPLGEGRFVSPLIGRFNLMNVLQAVGVLIQQGLSLEKLLEHIINFPGVPGRMQKVSIPERGYEGSLPIVLVDYAHTPDGLRNALLAARPFVNGRLICVFGCGGDRDRGKRAQMGSIASELADQVVITSDNPRTEDPRKILDDILTDISNLSETIVEINRSSAIEIAISKASIGDVVLIAGKGHEDYQIVGTEKIHFDDREAAERALNNKLTQ